MSKHVIVSDRSHEQIAALAMMLTAQRGRPVSYAEVVEWLIQANQEFGKLLAAQQDGGA